MLNIKGLAVNANDYYMSKMLLEYGASPDIGIPELKRSPLHVKILLQFYLKIFQHLIIKNLIINFRCRFSIKIWTLQNFY
jgi:hypothetical protein